MAHRAFCRLAERQRKEAGRLVMHFIRHHAIRSISACPRTSDGFAAPGPSATGRPPSDGAVTRNSRSVPSIWPYRPHRMSESLASSRRSSGTLLRQLEWTAETDQWWTRRKYEESALTCRFPPSPEDLIEGLKGRAARNLRLSSRFHFCYRARFHVEYGALKIRSL